MQRVIRKLIQGILKPRVGARIPLSLIFIATTFSLTEPAWSDVDALAQASSSTAVAQEAGKKTHANEPPANLKPIEEVANAWLRRPELARSQVGLEIMHIPSATVLFSHNGSKRFVPASTTKVFSTACAMDMLGPNYTYTTKLLIYGKIEGSHLNGSLFIEPSQDPTLKTQDIREMLNVLQAKGIKSIEGKVDIVGIPGGGDRFCSQWLVEDWGQDWMPVPTDFVLDDNIARKDPARGYPLIPYTVGRDQNAIVSSALRSPDGPAWLCFHPGSKTMQFWHPDGPLVGGQIVGNPLEYNLAIVQSLVKQMGIKVKEKTIPVEVMESPPTVIAEHHSKPLFEIIKHCLKESDNLYAQQLLRTVGNLPAVSKGVEKATLEERGLARLNQWLLAMGVAPAEVLLWDGCGLSRKDCFTPHSLNLVHRHMAGALLKSTYIDVMPHYGEEDAVNGTFHYKTGTMDCVRAISGILFTAAGEPLAVTVMVNDHSPSIRDVRSSMTGMINRLQSLGSLRLPTVPVHTIVITPNKGASRSGKTAAAPKKTTPIKHAAASSPKKHKRHKTH